MSSGMSELYPDETRRRELLRQLDATGWCNIGNGELAALLTAPPSLGVRPAPGQCAWTGDSEGIFTTDCGHSFVFTEGGGPGEDGIDFCCYCSKPIKRQQQCWNVGCGNLATDPLARWPSCESCDATAREEEADAERAASERAAGTAGGGDE